MPADTGHHPPMPGAPDGGGTTDEAKTEAFRRRVQANLTNR
jgi:hypothetical protein